MSIFGRFNTATGVLVVSGHNLADPMTISLDPNGTIQVNGGAVPIAGGMPTVANTSEIQLLGDGWDDVIVTRNGSPALTNMDRGAGGHLSQTTPPRGARDLYAVFI